MELGSVSKITFSYYKKFIPTSASPRDLSPLVSSTAEIVTAPASQTTDQGGPDEALVPQDGSCNRNT